MFLIFFSIALLILGGVHFYFYRRLVVAPALPPPWRTVVTAALVLAALSFPVSFFLTRGMEPTAARFVLYPVYIWMGITMMLFFSLLAVDALRAIGWLGERVLGSSDEVADPERRLLLARAVAAATTGAVFAAAGYSLWRGLGRLAVRRVEVVLPKLPRALDGFTVAQLTDLHLGPMRRGSWVKEVVERTNALGADLIAITGDLADATPTQLAAELATLGRLDAPHGVFFVTGNHEYFIDLDGWLAALARVGIRVLRNERVPIGQQGAAFDLAGIDDHEGKRLAPGHGPDLAKALEGRNPDRAVVLLAHQPRAVLEACRHEVGLVLSGHTHGGQIWPWSYLVYLQQPYVRGLHEHRGTQVYISAGTGFWGPPMRLGSTAEITLVTLRSKGDAAV